jgi:hypothetical protein
VFGEDLHPDPQQDEAADDLGPAPQRVADPAPEEDPDDGEGEGHEADDEARQPDRDLQEGQAEADGEGVDARGDREDEEHPAAGGIVRPDLRLAPPRLPEHLPAHEGEEAEGDPVVDLSDVGLDRPARQPADDRHQELEEPEVEGEAQRLAAGRAPEDEPRPDRDGEGVHREADGEAENRESVHGVEVRRRAAPSGRERSYPQAARLKGEAGGGDLRRPSRARPRGARASTCPP